MQEEMKLNWGSGSFEEFMRTRAKRLATAHGYATTRIKSEQASMVASKWNERLRSVFPPGAASTISPARFDFGPAPQDSELSWDEEVWVRMPDQSRTEGEDPRGGHSLLIVDATAWVGWDPFRGAIGGAHSTNPRTRAIDDALAPKHSEIALALLRPWQIVRQYDLRFEGDEFVAQRQALRYRGTPLYSAQSIYESGGDSAPAVFEGAEAAAFWVDSEWGVLLRWAGLYDGEEFGSVTFTSVDFNERLDNSLFATDAAREWMRRRA